MQLTCAIQMTGVQKMTFDSRRADDVQANRAFGSSRQNDGWEHVL